MSTQTVQPGKKNELQAVMSWLDAPNSAAPADPQLEAQADSVVGQLLTADPKDAELATSTAMPSRMSRSLRRVADGTMVDWGQRAEIQSRVDGRADHTRRGTAAR